MRTEITIKELLNTNNNYSVLDSISHFLKVCKSQQQTERDTLKKRMSTYTKTLYIVDGKIKNERYLKHEMQQHMSQFKIGRG